MYGANGHWTKDLVDKTSPIVCSTSVFGDPFSKYPKTSKEGSCFIKNTTIIPNVPVVPISTNGTCGTAAKTYAPNANSYSNSTFCATGTPSPATPSFPVA